MSRTFKLILILSTLTTMLIICTTALTTMVHTMECEQQQRIDDVFDGTTNTTTQC